MFEDVMPVTTDSESFSGEDMVERLNFLSRPGMPNTAEREGLIRLSKTLDKLKLWHCKDENQGRVQFINHNAFMRFCRAYALSAGIQRSYMDSADVDLQFLASILAKEYIPVWWNGTLFYIREGRFITFA